MTANIQHWAQSHSADYQTVLARLERARATLLDGELETAADMLEKSYMFAVLSIKTDKDRHERGEHARHMAFYREVDV